MIVILFCKGENEVLKTVCFNGTYTQAEDYINNRAEIPEGTTRTLINPSDILTILRIIFSFSCRSFNR